MLKILLADGVFYCSYVFKHDEKAIMEQMIAMLCGYGIEMSYDFKYTYGVSVCFNGKWDETLDWFISVFKMYGYEVYISGKYF